MGLLLLCNMRERIIDALIDQFAAADIVFRRQPIQLFQLVKIHPDGDRLFFVLLWNKFRHRSIPPPIDSCNQYML